MNNKSNLGIFIIFVTVAVHLSAAENTLESINAVYDKSLEKIDNQNLTQTMSAMREYKQTLESLANKYQQQGALDQLMETKDEIKRFDSGISISDKPAPELPAAVLSARQKCKANISNNLKPVQHHAELHNEQLAQNLSL